jgi:hypothetical protein
VSDEQVETMGAMEEANEDNGAVVRSPKTTELELLSGFVALSRTPPHGQRKVAAGRLRARCVAASMIATRSSTTLHDIAEAVGKTERYLSERFQSRRGIVAFPLPELAGSIFDTITSSSDWAEVEDRLRQLFVLLNANPKGRQLLIDLVAVRSASPRIVQEDEYFLAALVQCLGDRFDMVPAPLRNGAAFLTESLRSAISEWAETPELSLDGVADCVCQVIASVPSLLGVADPLTWRFADDRRED